MCPCNRASGYQCDSCRERDARVFAAKIKVARTLCEAAHTQAIRPAPSADRYIARIRAGQD